MKVIKITKSLIIKLIGVILILWGIFALFTPFTPGSWIGIVLGLIILVGKEKASNILKKVLGEKFYQKTKIDYFLNKFSKE